MTAPAIFVLVFLVLAIYTGFASIKIVKQGYEYTVLRLGRFNRVLSPGFHILVPFYESVGHKVNMKEQVLDVPKQEVISKDNAMITIDGIVYFQIVDSAKSVYAVDDLVYAIQNLAMTNLRTVTGSMTFDDLNLRRDSINADLLRVIDLATDPWGVKVTRVEIKELLPPKDLVEAMMRQKKAEQIKRAQILEAEGERQSEILRAEGNKQALVLAAEGRKESAFLDAQARERMAEAEAKATEMVSDAIEKGDVQAVNYFIAQKYVEALAKFATSNNQKTFFMPVESSNLLGSLAGIAELFNKDGKSNTIINKLRGE
ncbi:MAG: SPFH/Band 7/PHB domain protein [Cardiobacteriaceae bacterium]|nr:SPFH/Band 7/PHB domain protein [Cardiobacteriaceae bacterium]